MKKLGLTLSFALALSVVTIGGATYTVDNGPNPTKTSSYAVDNGPNPTMPAKNYALGSYKMSVVDNGPNPT